MCLTTVGKWTGLWMQKRVAQFPEETELKVEIQTRYLFSSWALFCYGWASCTIRLGPVLDWRGVVIQSNCLRKLISGSFPLRKSWFRGLALNILILRLWSCALLIKNSIRTTNLAAKDEIHRNRRKENLSYTYLPPCPRSLSPLSVSSTSSFALIMVPVPSMNIYPNRPLPLLRSPSPTCTEAL